MIRMLSIGIAVLIAAPGLASAQGGSGEYVLTQPRHKAGVKKIDALSWKMKTQESKLKKLPKSKTLCVPPGGGKPRAC